MNQITPYLPSILQGLITTIAVAVLSILGAAAVSVVVGVLRTLPSRLVQRLALVLVELMRGASAVIYLFWVYYALSAIPGAPQLSPFTASVFVLSAIGGAYGAEIVRGGIQAVAASQRDACRALGLSGRHTLTRIVLPQALSQIVPSFASLAVDLVKWTSIVSFVGVQDVFYAANTARTATNQTVLVFIVLAVLYLVLSVCVAALFRGIEYLLPMNRANRKARSRAPRTPPPRHVETPAAVVVR
ncbi:amino acid ABC transporter permease [Amycolatopsis sp. 3B14]|uniref:amino acid ABC transporter permease n=1 Tax=Amycolatopsis sp. 3B14 TaxID=3243600 RepID=UPI003D952619